MRCNVQSAITHCYFRAFRTLQGQVTTINCEGTQRNLFGLMRCNVQRATTHYFQAFRTLQLTRTSQDNRLRGHHDLPHLVLRRVKSRCPPLATRRSEASTEGYRQGKARRTSGFTSGTHSLASPRLTSCPSLIKSPHIISRLARKYLSRGKSW
jgi:hypothetical protein